jgi:hypothetical protein
LLRYGVGDKLKSPSVLAYIKQIKKKFQVVLEQALVLIDLFLKWELFRDFLKTSITNIAFKIFN